MSEVDEQFQRYSRSLNWFSEKSVNFELGPEYVIRKSWKEDARADIYGTRQWWALQRSCPPHIAP
jgi:hypothetical protein